MEAPEEHTEMASTFIAREVKHQIASLYIKCMNGETRHLPHNPITIFTEEELDKIANVKQRIFYSYFSLRNATLHARLSFDPKTEFDYLLIGIYYGKNGMDDEILALLDRRPELFIFTDQGYFEALFTPYLEYTDFSSITISPEEEGFPLRIILDGESYDCLSLAERLHGSPLLKDVTYHMTTHYHIFREEIDKRNKEASEYGEMIHMISNADDEMSIVSDGEDIDNDG